MKLHLNPGDRVVLADHGFGTVCEIVAAAERKRLEDEARAACKCEYEP